MSRNNCQWKRGDRVRLVTDYTGEHPATVVKVVGPLRDGLSPHTVLVDYDDGRRLDRGCKALEALEEGDG